ncbi:TPA: type VI secretion system contractile sheath small subunit, partial [Escherichia coli]|nr:type VI secretion system contractile sheath small subunit [Escherichia coli]
DDLTLIELKNNFDAVLSEYSPKVNLIVNNTLADDGSEDSIRLHFWTSYHRTGSLPEDGSLSNKPGRFGRSGQNL